MRLVIPLAMLIALAATGCVSHGRMSQEGPGTVSEAIQTQLDTARAARAKYQELFQGASQVEDAKAAEAEIVRLDQKIAQLELSAAIERRARHEPRTIVYGPLGFVFNVTEWFLSKLYIWEIK